MRNVSILNYTIGRCLLQSFWVDMRNIALFALMVICALDSQSVSLPLWALSCARHKAASNIRRFTRWLKNSAVDAHMWYKPLFLYAIGVWGNSPILLALDTNVVRRVLRHKAVVNLSGTLYSRDMESNPAQKFVGEVG